MISDSKMAAKIAQALLEIEAVSLRPAEPFTWASGLRAPIYCDNRTTLAFPRVRSMIARGIAEVIQDHFAEVDVIAGTATAGIAHAALVASVLDLPMAYVRSAPKDHGQGNQIEGRIEAGQKVVMVEDLISTGGSVLRAAKAVNAIGAEVLGVTAIFNYDLERGRQAFVDFQPGGLPLFTLSHFPVLVKVATSTDVITSAQAEGLAHWSDDPQAWSDQFTK